MVIARSAIGRWASNRLRPWVAARSVRLDLCKVRKFAIALGRPFMRGDQDEPLLPVRNVPISVAMHKVLANTESTTTLFTGTLGRLPLMSFQLLQPLVVLKTWPRLSLKPLKPEKVT